jgi:hypothetical protein
MILDPQKQAVYAWEGAWKDWNETNQTIPELRRIIRKACRMYRVKPPTVTAHTHKEWTTYFPDAARISFERSQRNTAIALHEAAHHILFTICKQEADEESDGNFEDHGPEFLGVYLCLLAHFGVAPRTALVASAEAAGLKFLTLAEAEPVRFRRRVAKELS